MGFHYYAVCQRKSICCRSEPFVPSAGFSAREYTVYQTRGEYRLLPNKHCRNASLNTGYSHVPTHRPAIARFLTNLCFRRLNCKLIYTSTSTILCLTRLQIWVRKRFLTHHYKIPTLDGRVQFIHVDRFLPDPRVQLWLNGKRF